MGRFIEGCDRREQLFLPACVDDYVAEDSAVRIVDVFVDELDLATLGFADAAATGRPGYHPARLLKLYIYGYQNQVQSSRRLEREAGRNVELMWLTGKLAPDFKTIADFRREHGAAIQAACRRFVLLCRQLGLIAGGTVAVDGIRFRAVNARDRNFTPVTIRRRMEQVDASITRYLGMLDTADRREGDVAEMRTARLTERLGELRRQMRELEAMEEAVAASPDNQISLTDPDARAMASAGTGTGLVGYNLQAAVDTDSHIVVAHEVLNLSHDRTSLATMGYQAREATGAQALTVLADRGYFSGPEVLACEAAGNSPRSSEADLCRPVDVHGRRLIAGNAGLERRQTLSHVVQARTSVAFDRPPADRCAGRPAPVHPFCCGASPARIGRIRWTPPVISDCLSARSLSASMTSTPPLPSQGEAFKSPRPEDERPQLPDIRT